MFVKIGLIMYRVLEIFEYATEQDSKFEYLCTNGKYNTVFNQNQFREGETFI